MLCDQGDNRREWHLGKTHSSLKNGKQREMALTLDTRYLQPLKGIPHITSMVLVTESKVDRPLHLTLHGY